MPEFFNTMSSTVLGSAADLYQPLPTFQLPQAKFQLYSSLLPQDDTPLNLDSPFREEYCWFLLINSYYISDTLS